MPEANDWLKREQFWLAAAVIAAVIVFLGVLFGTLVALFADGDASAINGRVDRLYKLGLIGAGFVTFCTVVWRGLIATKQADLQQVQIGKVTDQIAATERNNLAALLQKGAELIADDKPARVAAGIASLEAVGRGVENDFAIQAMDIIADFIQQQDLAVFYDARGQSAITAIELIHLQTGRTATRELLFFYDPDEDQPWEDVTCRLVPGVRRAEYANGVLENVELTFDTVGKTEFRFLRMSFKGGYIDTSAAEFDTCKLRGARIVGFNHQLLTSVSFQNCCFSGCAIADSSAFPDLRQGRNWYDPHNPPTSGKPIDWTTKLHKGHPPDLDETDAFPW